MSTDSENVFLSTSVSVGTESGSSSSLVRSASSVSSPVKPRPVPAAAAGSVVEMLAEAAVDGVSVGDDVETEEESGGVPVGRMHRGDICGGPEGWNKGEALLWRRPKEYIRENYFRTDEDWLRENKPVEDCPTAELDAAFAGTQVRCHGDFSQSGFEVLRCAFRVPGEYVFRQPAPEERIYHRPAGPDGLPWVGISINHFRMGLRLPLHRFIFGLFVDHFKLGLGQITPNSILYITSFIALCKEWVLEPTYRLFFSIFRLQRSKKEPLFELHWINRDFMFAKGETAYKNWHWEWVFFAGGNLAWLPQYRLPGPSPRYLKKKKTAAEAREAKAVLKHVLKFCGRAEGLITPDDMGDDEFIFRHLCKYSLNV